MVTQQKKNKHTLSYYYFTSRYSRYRKKRYFYRKKRYFYRKQLRLSAYEKRRLLMRVKTLYSIRIYSLFFSKNRIDAVRLKVYLFKFKRRFKAKL